MLKQSEHSGTLQSYGLFHHNGSQNDLKICPEPEPPPAVVLIVGFVKLGLGLGLLLLMYPPRAQ